MNEIEGGTNGVVLHDIPALFADREIGRNLLWLARTSLLELDEIAKRLHIDHRAMRAVIIGGCLPVVRIPGCNRIFVCEYDLARFIKTHRLNRSGEGACQSCRPEQEPEEEKRERLTFVEFAGMKGIYFLRAEMADSPIKIGRSDNMAERLKQLQMASPFRLTLLGWLPGGEKKEKELHEKFRRSRLHGEWFKPDRTLLEFIQTNTKSAPPTLNERYQN